MGLLTFQSSTVDKSELAKLVKTDNPFQIIPGGRGVLSESQLDTFPIGVNRNVLIHSSYVCRPFGNSIEVSRYCLQQYTRLAKKIGSNSILVHLPKSKSELNKFASGVNLLTETVQMNNCVVHLEIEPLAKDLRDITPDYNRLIDVLFESVPSSYRMVVDTAHLFSNGLDGRDQIAFIEKWKDRIDYIHLNGNTRPMFTSDKHIPIFDSRNVIPYSDELSKYLAESHFICIAENSTEHSNRDEWVKYANKYGFEIVPYSSTHEY